MEGAQYGIFRNRLLLSEEVQDLLADLHQLGVSLGWPQSRQWPTVLRPRRERGDVDCLSPQAVPHDDWHDLYPLLRTAFEEVRDLAILNERRGEEVRRNEEHRYASLPHCVLDFLEPCLAGADEAIVPDPEAAVSLQASQVCHEAVLPDLVLVAVADEDGRGHARMLAGFDVNAATGGRPHPGLKPGATNGRPDGTEILQIGPPAPLCPEGTAIRSPGFQSGVERRNPSGAFLAASGTPLFRHI